MELQVIQNKIYEVRGQKVKFKVEKERDDDTKLVLTVNKRPIPKWFKKQIEKLRPRVCAQACKLKRKVKVLNYKRQSNSIPNSAALSTLITI